MIHLTCQVVWCGTLCKRCLTLIKAGCQRPGWAYQVGYFTVLGLCAWLDLLFLGVSAEMPLTKLGACHDLIDLPGNLECRKCTKRTMRRRQNSEHERFQVSTRRDIVNKAK